MSELGLLRDLVVIFSAALAVVLLFTRLRLPTIAGFIVAGALLGPGGLGAVRDVHQVQRLAEIGVALLLFTIGLEFSLDELRRLGRILSVGGSLQVGLTTAVVAALAVLAGTSAPKGVFVGFLVALSSTAIVLKGLAERGEVDAPHGKLIVGVLLFQDLCVVPMMLLAPALAGQGSGVAAILRPLLTAGAVVAGALALARLVVPRALHLVAATRRRDLFVLAILLVAATIAWLTSLVGLSLALGAFLAGMVLAGSDYGHQALADTLALRDIFTSLFFVSVGMLLDPSVIVVDAGPVLGLVAAVLVGKALVASLAGIAMRFPLRVAILAGLGLAQIGEFSFVLATLGGELRLLEGREMRLFFAASVLTMLLAPLALRFGPGIAAGAVRIRALDRLLRRGTPQPDPRAAGASGHVLVLGYGVGGEMLTEVLAEARVPFVVLDLNAERVRDAQRRGRPVYYGDVTSREMLERAGAAAARQVAVLLNDPDATLRAVRAVRQLAPGAVITARARYVADVPRLLHAGADEAVAQEFEASFTVIERVTREARAPRPARAAMRARLGLEPAPGGERGPELPAGLAVQSVPVPEAAWVSGRTLAET
ncbi:MAG TPA: cation:proton antiporter, partial [Vicinamibacteria bacterium]|nr:cation:proton antiporter [Vicinamibacteria bacterium]